MALVLADRVKETTASTGSGPFVMGGAATGYQTVSAGIGDGNSSYFAAWDGAANWMVFRGTFTQSGNLLSVNQVIAQSAGFTGFTGPSQIWCDSPAVLMSPLLQMSASASGVQVTTALGIGMIPANAVDVTQSINVASKVSINNPNAGNNASAGFWAYNGGASSGALFIFGAGFTTSGVNRADGVKLVSSGAGGLTIGPNNAQPLYFITGNAEVARFDVNGRLGIGVVPGYIFHVSQNVNNSAWGYIANPSTGNNANSGWLASNGTSIAYTFMMSTGYVPGAPFRADGGGLFCNGAGGLSLGTTSAQPIYFYTNGSEVARFDVNGNLGIGTVPPAGTQMIVDIARNQNQAEYVRITNNNTGTGAASGIVINNSSSGVQLMQLSTNYSYSNPLYHADGSMLWAGGGGGLTFLVSQAVSMIFATNNVEIARFDGLGNFGIGKIPSTGAPLEIERDQNNSTYARIWNTSAGNQASAGYVANNGASNFLCGQTGTGYTVSGIWKSDQGYCVTSGNGGMMVGCLTANTPLTFIVASAEQARFHTNGYFGIGTPAPAYNFDLLSVTAINMRWQTAGNAGIGFLYADNAKVQIGSLNGVVLSLAMNGSEAARIDLNGNMEVGTTTAGGWSGNSKFSAQCNSSGSYAVSAYNSYGVTGGAGAIVARIDTTSNVFCNWIYNGTQVGWISYNGSIMQYASASDKNLKTLDPTRTLNSGQMIDAVSPHEFIWNASGKPDFGFFAQELHEAIGDAVPNVVMVGSPDEDFGTDDYQVWGIDLSSLIPVMWQELQMLRMRVASLEGAPMPSPMPGRIPH